MKTYLENEISDSLKAKTNDGFRVGRRVNVVSGKHSGVSGVVQNYDHSCNAPLSDDKIRVWLDGYSCIDVFDFDQDELELIPYSYVPDLGYF